MIKNARPLALFLPAVCFFLSLSIPAHALQQEESAQSSLLFVVFLVLLAAVYIPMRRMVQNSQKEIKKLRTIADQISAGVLLLLPEANYSIDYVSEGFFQLIGQTDSSIRLSTGSFTEYVHPDDLPVFEAVVEEAKMYGGQLAVELRLRSFDGFIPTLLRGTLLQKKDHRPALYCVLVDYSDHQNLLNLLNSEHERYSLIVEQSDDIIFDFDLEEGSVVTSSKYIERFAQPPQMPASESDSIFKELLHPDDRKKLLEVRESFLAGAGKQTCRVRLQEQGGHYRWYDIVISLILNAGKPVRYVGKLVDVHEQVLEFEWMEMKVHTDPMTGVLNKEAFYLWAEEYITHGHETSAVLFVDLDKFKQLNDTLGHMIGDRVLQDVALKIQACFRRDDLVARFGGDEFCILAKGIPLAQVTKKAAQLVNTLRLVYTDDLGQTAGISASVGVALAPDHGQTVAEVLDCADKALYAAKDNGRNQFWIYGQEK